MEIHVADYKSFNKQADGYNCGVHICLIAEHFLMGRVDMRVDYLDVLPPHRLTAERLRYRQLLCVTRPNLKPSHSKGTLLRHPHPAQLPIESTDSVTLEERCSDAVDHVDGSCLVTESTKRLVNITSSSMVHELLFYLNFSEANRGLIKDRR